MARTSGDKIAEALFDCLTESGAQDLFSLEDEIREFKTKYWRSYDAVKKQPFTRKLLDAIEEAIDFTIKEKIAEATEAKASEWSPCVTSIGTDHDGCEFD